MNFDEFRKNLRIDQVGSVDIVFGRNDYVHESGMVAMFNCLACDVKLMWTGTYNRYECPECGIELTAQEAVDLCDKYSKLIANLATESGKKRTFWQKVFG